MEKVGEWNDRSLSNLLGEEKFELSAMIKKTTATAAKTKINHLVVRVAEKQTFEGKVDAPHLAVSNPIVMSLHPAASCERDCQQI